MQSTLIILSGLPGTGKTTIARELARELAAVHLRIDTIEQALRDAGITVIDHGYRVAYALAEDNLRLGRTVIADSVNPLVITRKAWHAVAERAGARYLEVEIVCSDKTEHRRRVESRTPTSWATNCRPGLRSKRASITYGPAPVSSSIRPGRTW